MTLIKTFNMRKKIKIAIFSALGVILPLSSAHAETVRIAQLRIKPDQLAAFKEAVREEMRDALRLEPGVIAIYAVADRTDPNCLTFFERYVDDEAYEFHRETPHFKKYFETTKSMILERVLVEALPVEMQDKR